MKILAAYPEGIMAWPDSTMIRSGKPLFLPADERWRLLIAPGIKISRLGKSITAKFAPGYFEETAPMALLLPLRAAESLLAGLHPYATDLAADCAVVCGDFIPKEDLNPQSLCSVCVKNIKNGETEKTLDFGLSDFITHATEAVVSASRRNTLKIGDLVFPCFHYEILEAIPDTRVIVKINNSELLTFNIK